MFIRDLWVYFVWGVALVTPALEAQYLVTFQGPITVSQDPTVTFFDPTTLKQGPTLSVPGAFQFLSLPDGSELYFIMNTQGTPGPAIEVVHPQSGTKPGSAHQIGNFTNTLNCAVLSPDGRRLIVGENAVHFFDTRSNIDLTPNGIAIGGGATIIALAVSYDSQAAYALATYNGASYLAAISIPQLTVTNILNLTGAGSALALGPNGLLYVGLPNQILEINPATFTTTLNGTVAVEATPGPLAFTPDGNYLVMANQTYGTQPALLLLNLNDHLVEGTIPFTGLPALAASPITGTTAVFDSLYVASANVIYPFSSGGQSLFEMQLGSSGGLSLNIPIIGGISSTTQAAMALSNDLGVPGRNFPQFLFTISDINDPSGLISLFRIDPESNLLTSQALLSSTPGAVAYYAPTFTTNTPDTILQYGDNQTLQPGGTSLPLVIRVLDQNGLPIAGAGVSFGPPFRTTGTITPINTVTGADGYAQAIYTAGITPADIGSLAISASAGPVSVSFTVTVGTPASPPAALVIVSGQGQLVQENLSAGTRPQDSEPLVVQANDSTGDPVANTFITFTVTAGNGLLLSPSGTPQRSATVLANTQGQASIQFVPPLVGVTQGTEQDIVTASVAVPGSSSGATSTVSQKFYITSMPLNTQYCGTNSCTPIVSVSAQVLQPAMGSVLTGAAGSTLPNPVLVRVFGPGGKPLANAGVRVSTGTGGPNASCAGANGGLALTDATGLATCNVLLNGVPGTAPLTISVPLTGFGNGSGLVFSGYTLTIQAGAPAAINIITGNNQTSVTNAALPVPFTVQVTDSDKNLLPGVPVSWKVTSGSMTLTSASTVTDMKGEASANGFVHSPGGTAITLQVTAGGASAVINAYVFTPPASVAIVSGDNQSAPINQGLSLPLVAQGLDKNNNPTPYAPITFVASGTIQLSAVTVMADATGSASVQVNSVGAAAGAYTVKAEYLLPKNSPSVSFTVIAQPIGPTDANILSSASWMPGIAPGGLVTLIGSGLAPTIQGVVTDPSQMQGYSVSFDGIVAPILAIANENGTGQINAQVPFEEQPSDFDSITIATPNGSIGLNDVTVSYFAPAIFTNGTIGPSEPMAVALRPDGSYVSSSNPAQRGENITFFATGLGQTSPNASTGVPGVEGQNVGGTLFAGVNNQGDQVVSAVYQPNALGVYAVTIQIPSTTLAGPAQPLNLLMVDPQGNGYTAPLTYLPIQ